MAEILARLSEAAEARSLAFYQSQASLQWLSREEVHTRATDTAGQLIAAGLRARDVCLIIAPSGEKCSDDSHCNSPVGRGPSPDGSPDTCRRQLGALRHAAYGGSPHATANRRRVRVAEGGPCSVCW